MNRFIALAAAALIPASGLAASWDLDPSHTSAEFKVRHLMVSDVRGGFGTVSGTAEYDPAKPASLQVEATIDAASINTRDAKRDEHLRSPDFFDVANHPTLTFKSKKAASAGKGKIKLTGDLTIRGVTREVTFQVEGLGAPVTDPWGNESIGGRATTKINRKDFGLTWNKALETGGVLVGDQVQIDLDFQFKKKAAEKTAGK